ncbi:MAG: ATP-binding protein [Desulfobacteraceae bacterium]|nr:MAG: ATP-binding protein [Desulfobacteraceae bacterium]
MTIEIKEKPEPNSPAALLNERIQNRLAGIKRKLLVMSGKGGVGKSTVAAYLALLLADRGYKVGLMDIDLHGPSIPRLLGIQGGLVVKSATQVEPYVLPNQVKVVSMEMMLGENKDTAVIWRGPLKISAIKQFIADIEWGALDFLVLDSPPGTGDEPLTIAQTIKDAEAVIVTTPQEVSLADVRKSIQFCRQVKMSILGVIENMSAFGCPHCREKIALFGQGGGADMARQMGVPFLGEIPLDPDMVRFGDRGQLSVLIQNKGKELNSAYRQILSKIEQNFYV